MIKKSLLFFVMSIFAISVFAKDLQELVVTTNPPLSCENCEKRIKGNLRFEKGVKDIQTSIPEQRVAIKYDADKTNPQQIEEAFNKIGYKVEEIKSSDDSPSSTACQSPTDNCCQKDKNSK